MSTSIIFIFGACVTLLTLAAMFLIGLNEAADPGQSRPEDVADWERNLINRPADE